MSDETQNETPEPQAPENGKINPVLVTFLVLPLIGIIIALVLFATDIQSEQNPDTNSVFDSTNPTTLINSEAPEFVLNDLNGQPVALSDYRGKILFLNFWQTTCPPCIEEMPDFIEFMADQPDDVTWLTVNFGETDRMVREFFAEYDFLGIPTVLDTESDVRYGYGVFGAPVTFVIDEEGIIQYMNIGQLSYDDMDQLVESVRNGAS